MIYNKKTLCAVLASIISCSAATEENSSAMPQGLAAIEILLKTGEFDGSIRLSKKDTETVKKRIADIYSGSLESEEDQSSVLTQLSVLEANQFGFEPTGESLMLIQGNPLSDNGNIVCNMVLTILNRTFNGQNIQNHIDILSDFSFNHNLQPFGILHEGSPYSLVDMILYDLKRSSLHAFDDDRLQNLADVLSLAVALEHKDVLKIKGTVDGYAATPEDYLQNKYRGQKESKEFKRTVGYNDCPIAIASQQKGYVDLAKHELQKMERQKTQNRFLYMDDLVRIAIESLKSETALPATAESEKATQA
ncbi:MAG: hypothetical protein KBD31_02665 [Proteobacteria bacterium]|nr:hypothetical protein [Pseudomonadota bacterium]